ncbi:MAG: VPLPA-CTERM sorting domain-containing protein [Thiogranum sp.]|nr:VPLPA-CTERM sorting domain-containing protein [Thiogranum sp.]
MKKFLMSLGLVLLSQQSLAVTTVAGIDFLDIADTRGATTGTYTSNYVPGGSTAADSVVDGNGASWAFASDSPATMDLSFSSAGLFNISDVDLSILFVGDGGHAGVVTLLGGSLDGEFLNFGLANGEGYTGYNSVTANPPTVNAGAPTIYGIFATTLDLSDAFGNGTFSGLNLDISNSSAVPSLIGTTASAAVVPVPAAVWLFGSGLIGLVGLARRKQR